MHLSLWKPISHCAALFIEKKKSRGRDGDVSGDDSGKQRRPSILRQLHEAKLREALEEASEFGSLPKSCDIDSDGPDGSAGGGDSFVSRSRSLARLKAQKEFLYATADLVDQTFESTESISAFEECFSKFIAIYPDFRSSELIDQVRFHEYFHLAEPDAKVCLDYCGFGLFSYLQSFQQWQSSAFSLSEISANLSNHALYGMAERGTSEHDVRTLIMDYLNIPESDYVLVFTVSRGSAFRLLAESYPFKSKKKLLTMFDHESQSLIWMAQRAREKGAKVCNANFKWPSLKVCSSELRKMISCKKKKKKGDSATGLFVFPVQSRVSGVKYSYQWMAMAQQNSWHVLLDAGSLGPKDMDSLGLSFFRPDFIITSFYRVFGSDPTGFGCLLIKKSVMGCLQNQNGGTGSGIVRIVPVFPEYLSDSAEGLDDFVGEDKERMNDSEELLLRAPNQQSQMPAFSGAYTSAQVEDVIQAEMDQVNSSDMETESISLGEVMKSPTFSEDDSSDNSVWVDLGPSPPSSDSSRNSNRVKLASSLHPSWFLGGKNHTRSSLKLPSKKNRKDDDRSLSFDEAVLSVSQDSNVVKQNHERETRSSEIQEEPDHVGGEISPATEICHKSAIRKETESELRFLKRREGKDHSYNGGRFFGAEEYEHNVRPMINDVHSDEDDDDVCYDDDQEQTRKEPRIVCRQIDHVNMIGLNKIALRLRYLVNWLVTSMLHLQLPEHNGREGVPLVRIYGSKIKYERGAAVAFNVRDRTGRLIHPETVQKLGERNGISLGVGFLSHIRLVDHQRALKDEVEVSDASLCRPMSNSTIRLQVVTVSLGFLTNFVDVYKMWAFVARFLDPAFAESYGVLLATVPETSET
ncbi:Molybdenum cofactor sulfurase [Apostasia shenzhenica]|uniref:Molybdenum cofactor sulfurase n=1 Tax=Apostasia shenzhenica TaxID=1088818 RepID=A0A2I0AMN3_9ASPA|nr:Molybdenum cofactor sulfurase [Apostasia shenzhenica]